MSPVFGLTVILYALGLAGAYGIAAVGGHLRSRAVVPALAILELSVLVQAWLDAAAVLRGRHGPEVATHVGYLLTSVAVLPITVAAVRLDSGRWGSTALAVGCVLLAVVSLRLHQTLGVARA